MLINKFFKIIIKKKIIQLNNLTLLLFLNDFGIFLSD
jgi:hypothetical protein